MTIVVGHAERPIAQRLVLNGHSGHPDIVQRAVELTDSQSDARVLALYERLKGHDGVRWKDSIKRVVGLDQPSEPGLDV